MQRQHLRIAVLARQLICLLDRLLRLDCEFVPTNCHNVPPLSSLSRFVCRFVVSLKTKRKREMNFSSPVRPFISSVLAFSLATYPWRVFWPIPTLICRGLASARLASVIFKTPLS